MNRISDDDLDMLIRDIEDDFDNANATPLSRIQERDIVSALRELQEQRVLASKIEELQRFRSHSICNDCGSYDVVVPKS